MTDHGTVELPDDLRDRFDAIKAECKAADPSLPEPEDELVLSALMDTWDAAGDGYYADPSTVDEDEHANAPSNRKGSDNENEAARILGRVYGRGNVDKVDAYANTDPLRYIDVIASKTDYPTRFVQVKTNRFTAKDRKRYAAIASGFSDEIVCEVWVRVDYEGWRMYLYDRENEDWHRYIKMDTCNHEATVESFRDAAGFYDDPSDRRDPNQAGLPEASS